MHRVNCYCWNFQLRCRCKRRWSVEKFKGVIIPNRKRNNVIAKETRSGKGNFILCSSDVASALSMGVLDYTPALNTNINVDDTAIHLLVFLTEEVKVYIDPYAGVDYMTVGYRGSNPYDAGCSIAHMFHYKWFVQLERILSNQRLVSKQDTVWFQTHS